MKRRRRLAGSNPCLFVASLGFVAMAMAQAPPPAGPAAGGPPPDGPPGAPAAPFALPPLPADAPRPSPDPRNLEGTWFHGQPLMFRMETDMYGSPLPFTTKGRRIRDRRVKSTYEDGLPYVNASAECKPPGQPWQLDLNFPFQIYQSSKEIVFVFQEYHGIWNIRMNQPHRRSGRREYFGDSVGRWDGDTLVVDTIGYKQGLWLDVDGTPTSAKVHVVQRIRRIDYGDPKLEIVTRIDDSEMYTSPWSMVRIYAWRPDKMIFDEYNCEWQVGAPDGLARYGLVPEPPEE